ncbi:MAG: histidine phosphatase family protein, partial [Candidatus Heimdallarchaeota archaeon]|nr:histidine phosphatase family protein [Candidatus Heimdallarchaeota archaeon]
FEGRLGKEYREEMKDLLARKEKLSHSQQYKFKVSPDIESDEEIVNRLILFLREVSVAYAGMNMAAVSHGGVIINFLDHLGYLQKNKVWINNLSYALMQSDGVDFKIIKTDGLEELD